MPDLLVHGDILLASADAAPLPGGAVLIRDGAVAAVGDRDALRREHPGVEELGGDGMLVLPGLINAHHHGMAISTVQLGFPDPGPPEPGLRDTPFESWMATMLALDAVDPYLGTLAKDVLLIESGVTSHLHMHFPSGAGDGPPEDAYARELRETLRAHRDVGPARGAGAALARPLAPGLRRRRAVHRRAAARSAARERAVSRARACPTMPTSRRSGDLVGELAGDPLLSAQFAIMAPQWASDELVEAVGSAAAELGAGIHLHALESRLQRAWGDAFAGGRELERLADAGVLGDRSALAHGVWLRDSDIELLARSGATVVHNCLVEPAPRGGRRAAPPARRGGRRRRARARRHGHRRRRRHARRGAHGARAAARPRRGAASAAARRRGLRPDVGRRRARRRRARRSGGSSRGGAATSSSLDLRALRAPYAVGDVDVWELLVSRGKAAHVDSVVVEGRVLMRGRRLQHLDRDALMAEVAGRRGVGGRTARIPDERAWIAQLGRRIAEHYQAPVWHAGA